MSGEQSCGQAGAAYTSPRPPLTPLFYPSQLRNEINTPTTLLTPSPTQSTITNEKITTPTSPPPSLLAPLLLSLIVRAYIRYLFIKMFF